MNAFPHSMNMNGAGDMVTKDVEEALSAFFASDFIQKIHPEELQPLKGVGRSGEMKFYAELGGSS